MEERAERQIKMVHKGIQGGGTLEERKATAGKKKSHASACLGVEHRTREPSRVWFKGRLEIRKGVQ